MEARRNARIDELWNNYSHSKEQMRTALELGVLSRLEYMEKAQQTNDEYARMLGLFLKTKHVEVLHTRAGFE